MTTLDEVLESREVEEFQIKDIVINGFGPHEEFSVREVVDTWEELDGDCWSSDRKAAIWVVRRTLNKMERDGELGSRIDPSSGNRPQRRLYFKFHAGAEERD